MTRDNVIFTGGGSTCPVVMAWSNPTAGAKPRIISEFQQGYSVYALAVSPNGRRLAAGTKAGLLRVYALDDGETSQPPPMLFEVFHPPAIFGLAFCTDDILATGGYDGRIKVWSVSQGEQLGEISAHEDGVYALCRIGSLVLASIGGDGVMRVWDMDSLEAKHQGEPFVLPQIYALTSLDYSPQSGLLIHPSRNGDLHVYDVSRDFEKRLVSAHRGNFSAAAIGCDHIVTAGAADRTIKVWSAGLQETFAETSASAGALAVGWIDERRFMVVSDDVCGQIWTVGDGLQPGARFAGYDLRTTTGIPADLMARRRSESTRRWRDSKLAEAKELMGQPERRSELAAIVDELSRRGFSAESALLLADAAKARGQLLWELESRLGLIKGLGETKAAVPSLYALGELLVALKDPRLAEEYFRKALALDEGYLAARDRIESLQADPLRDIHPERHVRGDLTPTQHVDREIDKSTILDQTFRWRVIFTKVQTASLGVRLHSQQVSKAVLDALAAHGGNVTNGGLREDRLFLGAVTKDVTWVYVPAREPHGPIAFALEIGSNTQGTEIAPYGVFDPSLLGIAADASSREHNTLVKEAWTGYVNSSEGKRWLMNAATVAQEAATRLASQELARQDDEF